MPLLPPLLLLLLLLPTISPLSLFVATSPLLGAHNARRLKSLASETRIALLLGSNATSLELTGLLSKGDTYNPSLFPPSHTTFKATHNAILTALHTYTGASNAFVLDGADAGSTRALLAAGASEGGIYVANRYQSTCDCIPLPARNVVCENGVDALRREGVFGDVVFGVIYADACGQDWEPVAGMIVAALDRQQLPERVAVGFSLLGGRAENKEVKVVRRVSKAVSGRMLVAHVMDDPAKYGIEETAMKVEGGTCTTWLMLTRSEEVL